MNSSTYGAAMTDRSRLVLPGPRRCRAATALAQTAAKPPKPVARRQRPPTATKRRSAAAASRRSRHRPAPAGLRAAAAGDRARRDRRRRRPADGAERRRARPLPPHLPGAGQPASGRQADAEIAQLKDKTLMGYVGAQRLLEPRLHRALRPARGLAAGLQRPSRCAGDLPAGAGAPTPGVGRPHAGELRRQRQPLADLRRRAHRDRRRRRPRRRAARAPAADGRRRRLQRRLRAARPQVDGRRAGPAGSRAVARPRPHPRARGRFAARRAGAGRCQRAARRQLERRPLRPSPAATWPRPRAASSWWPMRRPTRPRRGRWRPAPSGPRAPTCWPAIRRSSRPISSAPPCMAAPSTAWSRRRCWACRSCPTGTCRRSTAAAPTC